MIHPFELGQYIYIYIYITCVVQLITTQRFDSLLAFFDKKGLISVTPRVSSTSNKQITYGESAKMAHLLTVTPPLSNWDSTVGNLVVRFWVKVKLWFFFNIYSHKKKKKIKMNNLFFIKRDYNRSTTSWKQVKPRLITCQTLPKLHKMWFVISFYFSFPFLLLLLLLLLYENFTF